MHTPQQSTNIYFLNVAKTIAIFLMALAHLPIPERLYAFINSFHMPLFFLISGYLLSVSDISFKTFLKKKITTLLLPYYFFVLVTFLFWFFIGRKFGNDLLTEYSLTKYLTGAVLAIPAKEFMGFNLPIWFLPSLFCTELIFYAVNRFFKKYAFLFSLALFALGVFIREIELFRFPYGLDVSMFSLLFVNLGYWLREKGLVEKYIVCRRSVLLKTFVLLLTLLLTLFISDFNGSVLMYQCYFNNYALFFAGALSGIVCTLYLASMVPFSPLFNFFGRNTILILAFHLMTFSLIKGIQYFLFGLPLELAEEYWYINILYVIIAFILLAPIIYLVNKYTPFLLGRKRGIL